MTFIGFVFGALAALVLRYVVSGFFTVNQNERAVKTSFGRAIRLTSTTLDNPMAEYLRPDERERYKYPQLQVILPGGPYFKWPWEKIYKVNIATETVNLAFDPEDINANRGGTELEGVTKDQLNIGLVGQLRFRRSDQNLYAYVFGVKRPLVHVLAFFVSVLRQKIASFEAPDDGTPTAVVGAPLNVGDLSAAGRGLDQRPAQEPAPAQRRHGSRVSLVDRALRHRARRLADHRHRPAR